MLCIFRKISLIIFECSTYIRLGILEASPLLLKMATAVGKADYNQLRLSIYRVSELVKISIQCENKSVNPLSVEQQKIVYILF